MEEELLEAAEQKEGWYSVWAQPSAGQEPSGLRPAMLQLSTLYQGPSFDPHVTVLGDHKFSLQYASLSLRAACRVLAPFTCRLTQPACGNTFYQCVYMLVDPSPEVMHANKVVESIFETPPHINKEKTGYLPHLSLVYADLSVEEREKGRKLVEEKFGPQLCDTQFLVSSLCLYSTDTSDKLLATWKKVAEYPLEGQSC